MKTKKSQKGKIHYLECVGCGKPNTTNDQKRTKRCRKCAAIHRGYKSKDDAPPGYRTCRTCQQILPNTEEHFYCKDKKNKRLDTICKVCDRKIKADNQRQKRKKM